MSRPTLEVEATCVGETEKAIRVEIEGESFWVPKSLIDDDSEVYADGHEGTLIIPEWWAEQEGIA